MIYAKDLLRCVTEERRPASQGQLPDRRTSSRSPRRSTNCWRSCGKQGAHRGRRRRVRRHGGSRHDRGPDRGDCRRDPGRVRPRGSADRAPERRRRLSSMPESASTRSTELFGFESQMNRTTTPIGGFVYHHLGKVPIAGRRSARRWTDAARAQRDRAADQEGAGPAGRRAGRDGQLARRFRGAFAGAPVSRRSAPHAAIWDRDEKPSFDRMLPTCVSTVRSLRTSCAAISRLEQPRVISVATSISRSVKPPAACFAACRGVGARLEGSSSYALSMNRRRCSGSSMPSASSPMIRLATLNACVPRRRGRLRTEPGRDERMPPRARSGRRALRRRYRRHRRQLRLHRVCRGR